MTSHFPFSVETLLLTGYIMFSTFLNMLALLISSFYQKKFNQASPKAGFLTSIIFALIFVIYLFIPQKNIFFLQIIGILSLLGSAVASIYSILYLFFAMSRVRK